jgi:hypothetical protein
VGNPVGREAIYSAFFTQLNAALLQVNGGPFNYSGRRPVPDTQLAEEQYPAFFLLEAGEMYDRSRLFAIDTVTLMANLSIVTLQGEVPDETNVTNLNNLADTVESAIQDLAGPTAQLTLNGLVQECWINHRTLVITGSYPQRTSKQNFMIEMILPHSR